MVAHILISNYTALYRVRPHPGHVSVSSFWTHTGDQIDKRIKFANEAFEFVEHAILKFKTGPWEKKKEILSTLGSNLTLMDKKLSVSLENSLVPMKTVSLLSGDIIAKVRTAKKPVNKTEIEQSLARFQSMLPRWDEFTKVPWHELFEFPEVSLMQMEKLLAVKD